MRTRLLILAAPLIAGFIVATTLLMGRDRFARPLFRHDADDERPKTLELKPALDGWCPALGSRCYFSQTQQPLADSLYFPR